MDVIEIQCGSCNQMMGVSVDHLGTQVHCPHCQSLVQTPDREALDPPEAPSPPASASPEPENIESFARPDEGSIFTTPVRDDLFDTEEPPAPRLEMPEPLAPAGAKPGPPLRPATAPVKEAARAAVPELSLEKSPPRATPSSPVPKSQEDHRPDPLRHDLGLGDDHVAPSTPLPVRRSSLLLPTLLIFLIPYSIAATGITIYLLIQQKNQPDPMERLPDPEPSPKNKKGPPRPYTRVTHDAELPAHLVTAMKKPVQIGDIQITPLQVRLTPIGDLVLRLKVKNLSKGHAFVPVSNAFLFVSDQADAAKPYTFLHAQDREKSNRAYGGTLAYLTPEGQPDREAESELLPGQEGILELKTLKAVRDGRVRRLLDSNRLLWRVQVRRGLIDVKGQPLSATAVIGVDFSTKEITRES